MKKLVLIILIFTYSFSFSQEKVELQINTLENGLKYVIVQNKKLPLVQVRIVFNGGARVDPQNSQGLTYLTAQMLLKGTTQKTAQQIAEEFEFLGSTIDISTNYDYSLLSTEFLKYNFETGMKILAELITSPALDGKEIDKEKEKLISELKSSLENSTYIANQFFNKIIFEGHPYSNAIQGTIKQIDKISSRQVRNHYKNYFVPNETILILYGDIEKSETEKLIKSIFSNWQKGNQIKLENAQPNKIKSTKIVLVDKPGLTQAQIRVGNIGINQTNPDEIPISIANTILGSGFTSRLVEEIRVKRSLTYGASSSFQKLQQSGKFVITTFTKNETVGEVIEIILNELQKLHQSGVSDWEINKAKNYMIGDLSRQLQSPDGYINFLTQIIYYNKDINLIKNFSTLIKNTPKEKIQNAIKEYFPKNDVLILVVGDAQKIKQQLEKFGNIQQLNYETLVE
ncbi:MAG: insulinase family protein [Ignavibacteria bacterium]|nr:insulinase family protein [Ignavibacteria bacterium]